MNVFVTIINVIAQWMHVMQLFLRLNEDDSSVLRRWWVKFHITTAMRNLFGAYQTLFLYYMNFNHEDFYHMTKMMPDDFEALYCLIGPRLKKASFREPLPPRLRLCLVLNVLANGDSIRTTQNLFRVGRSTIYHMIEEVCSVIWEELSPFYLRNRTSREWKIIAAGYRSKWDLPHCIGALDGKEVAIKCPPHSGSLFFNYKKFFSIKLLAICDAECRFTWVEAGDCGSQSDLASFRNTDFFDALRNQELNIPPSSKLPRSNIRMPYFFVGDEIFTLQTFLMIPFARRRPLTNTQKHYNYRLARARHTIEAAFGILTAMWQILKQPLKYHLETSIKVVLATVCLHNFVITRKLQRGERIDIPVFRRNADDRAMNEEEEDENAEYERIPRNAMDQLQLLTRYLNSNAGAMRN